MCGAISRCAISAASSPICRCSSVNSNAAPGVATASLIAVESPTGFAAVPAGGHVLLEQGARPVLRIAEAFVQHVHNCKACVQADEVGKLQRAHRMIHAELHHGVDGL